MAELSAAATKLVQYLNEAYGLEQAAGDVAAGAHRDDPATPLTRSA